MADQFLGEIRMFPFNFTPTGWAYCDGQLLPTSQNNSLFSLLGTTYGGDGLSTFALPNLFERAPMQPGSGPGLSTHELGERDGTDTVTLLQSEMPAHVHALNATSALANRTGPSGNLLAKASGATPYAAAAAPTATAAAAALPAAGGGLPHDNRMPYLKLQFAIAITGIVVAP